MRLKKLLTLGLTAAMLALVPLTANATPSHKPQYSYWNTLVLVLPDASIENYGTDRIVTTMHYSEIQKIQELASNIENNYGKGYTKINVDVKVDYDDLKSLSYDGISWNGVKPENVAKQLEKNAEYNQYDSIVVVYRDADNANNSNFTTNAYWGGKTKTSLNATFSTFALNDADHSMKYQNWREYNEFDILMPMLNSAYTEISKTNPNVVAPSTYMDWNNLEKSRQDINEYMFGSSLKGSLGGSLSGFFNYHPSFV